MNLVEIIKNQEFFQNIQKKWSEGTLKNSILFFCEDEKTAKVALILTALLIEYATFEMVNEKSAEFSRIENSVDLDVKVYPKNGEKLLVADSNDIVGEVFVKPVNLPRKIFLINNFDVSTDEAQNKLLKVLEEPPENVYFLLSAKSEERVLPTIKSRCEKVKINPLSSEEIRKICSDNLAVILGKGFVGRTLELEKNADLDAVARFAVSLVCDLKNSKEILKFSKKFLEAKEEIDLILEILALCLEDILKIKCESEELICLKPFASQLKDVEPEYSVLSICEITKLIAKLREKIEFNANLTVAIDNFLLKMLEVKYLCK